MYKLILPAILAGLLAGCGNILARQAAQQIEADEYAMQHGPQPYTAAQRQQWADAWIRESADGRARVREFSDHADRLIADLKRDCDAECAQYIAMHTDAKFETLSFKFPEAKE